MRDSLHFTEYRESYCQMKERTVNSSHKTISEEHFRWILPCKTEFVKARDRQICIRPECKTIGTSMGISLCEQCREVLILRHYTKNIWKVVFLFLYQPFFALQKVWRRYQTKSLLCDLHSQQYQTAESFLCSTEIQADCYSWDKGGCLYLVDCFWVPYFFHSNIFLV